MLHRGYWWLGVKATPLFNHSRRQGRHFKNHKVWGMIWYNFYVSIISFEVLFQIWLHLNLCFPTLLGTSKGLVWRSLLTVTKCLFWPSILHQKWVSTTP
jgi:hypothetical protein